MKFFASAAVLLGALSTLVTASPYAGHPTTTTTTTKKAVTTTKAATTTTSAFSRPTFTPFVCLTNTTANTLVTGFGSLLTAYNNDTANELLATNFTEYSQSINWLAGAALDSTTFPSKSAFETSQSTQYPLAAFTLTAIDAIACTTLAYRWEATLQTGDAPISGISIMYASNLNGTDAGWQIAKQYVEINSGLWSVQTGGQCA